MSTETLEQSTALAAYVPAREKAMQVFTTPGALDPYLAHVRAEIDAFTPDVTTKKGRDAIASMAYKVSQSKAALETLGKTLADEAKEIPKKIDASRKAMKETLDSWRDEVRKPLDDWDAEQERIRLAKEAEQKARELVEVVERDHGEAMLMNELHDRKKADELAAADRERVAREERIAKEAAENARIEAENKAANEKAAALLKAAQAEQLAETSRLRADAAELAKVAAETRADAAAQQERERIAAEQKATADAEAARAADAEHRKTINRRALEDLICSAGLDMTQGKAVVRAIASGMISNVKINY